MTYFPADFALDLDITTTEKDTGMLFDGDVLYSKLIKQSGNLSTGTTNIAHGITGLARVARALVCAQRVNGSNTEQIMGTYQHISSNFDLDFRFTATNLVVKVGSSWTGTGNILSDLWCVLFYTK